MLLFFPSSEAFATGAKRYQYLPVTPNESTNRIILIVEVGGRPVKAVVDTGAPYVILPPSVARLGGFNPDFILGREQMLIRRMRLDGSITRINITLIATFGEDLNVPATVFVPDREDLWGDFPAFIGLSGFLERIRFAVDPNSDLFYFGSLASTI